MRRDRSGRDRTGTRGFRPADWISVLLALAIGLLLDTVIDARAAGARDVGPLPESPPVLLDGFDETSGWTAHPASGVEMRLSSGEGIHGKALRVDFRFQGGGWAIARKELDLDLPENYEFSFQLRGHAPVNHLEFKLIDSSGENVWWHVRRDLRFPEAWRRFLIKKRQIVFAWGPAGGGEIKKVAALEVAVTAGSGGEGTVWIDDLEMRPLAPRDANPPAPRAEATSSAAGHPPGLALDGDSLTAWFSTPHDRSPVFTIDFGAEREFGGVVLHWVAGHNPSDYVVETSSDGREWEVLREVAASNGGRDPLLLTESEARLLRLRALGRVPSDGVALEEITVEPLEWGASPEAFFHSLAFLEPRGFYPRAILGEPVFWALVGPGDGDPHEGLLDGDGRLEMGKAECSLEPFLFTDGTLLTWNELNFRPGLLEDPLPIPTVRGGAQDLRLMVTAFAIGRADTASLSGLGLEPGVGQILARYRLQNIGSMPREALLFLALRPFQVNPPAQFLNTRGGTAPIRDLRRSENAVFLNETERKGGSPGAARGLTTLTRPTDFGALTFDQGDLVGDYLRRGVLPKDSSVRDPIEYASGALAYHFDLAPGEGREVALAIPLEGTPVAHRADVDSIALELALERCLAGWQALRDSIAIELPATVGHEVAASLWAQLAWILINRDGAAIQPGSRSYERSWIRDGALTSTALLRLGQDRIVHDFLLWFAGYQYPDGKVPCCVDRRGADPVPEHDSHGELIYLAAEYYRFTGDRETAGQVWPAVARAAAYIDSLRGERRTEEWRGSGREQFFGLLPPSISHEGYSAKPMHSYWDDFWALRGLRDAVFLAEELGFATDAARLQKSRDEFTEDLRASIAAAMKAHGIDYIPGCADLGDFDATSTTIALSPGEAAEVLPPGALERTFEKYWEYFRDRRDGKSWDAFTPYEMRTIGAFVRLGWRDRAQDLLSYFLRYREPAQWRQWPEVVWSDSTTQKFLGDLPHTWVGSDFVRSALDLLAYEQEEDGTLILAAGVPQAWLLEEGGVRVGNLPTTYGRLSYRASAIFDRSGGPGGRLVLQMQIEPGLRIPPGGILVDLPRERSLGATFVNDQRVAPRKDGRVLVRELPATVVIQQ